MAYLGTQLGFSGPEGLKPVRVLCNKQMQQVPATAVDVAWAIKCMLTCAKALPVCCCAACSSCCLASCFSSWRRDLNDLVCSKYACWHCCTAAGSRPDEADASPLTAFTAACKLSMAASASSSWLGCPSPAIVCNY
jgi:hypothetical protein